MPFQYMSGLRRRPSQMLVDVDDHPGTETSDDPNESQSGNGAQSDAESSVHDPGNLSEQVAMAEYGLPLGSDAWLSAAELEDMDSHAAHYNEEVVDWIELEKECSRLRGGVFCEIEEDKFTTGESSLVAKVVFHDGVAWAARLLCRPPPESGFSFWERNEFIVSEFATLQFLKSRTSIPVPEVYGYDKHDNNPVGVPYILVEYIHGTPALDMADTPNSWKDPEGVDFWESAKHENFKKQLAAIQTELAAMRFDQIGCIYEHDYDDDEFSIGTDHRTNTGPWKTAPEFFNDLASSAVDGIEQDEKMDLDAVGELDEEGFSSLPYVSQFVILKHREPSLDEGPFGLAHRRLGTHNVLVNEKFEILAVLGIRHVMAAPVEVQAQFPLHMGLDYTFPTEMASSLPYRVSEPNTVSTRYARIVEECEKTIGSDIPEHGRPGQWMTRAGSLAFLAMQRYETHEPEVIKEWTGYVLRLLCSGSYPFYRL